MSDIQGQLKEHLKNGNDWEKMETPIEGVSVVKIPATKTRGPLLHIEVNPLNERGTPMKRKGLFISSFEMFIKFRDALEDDSIVVLLKEIESVNPVGNGAKTKKLKM